MKTFIRTIVILTITGCCYAFHPGPHAQTLDEGGDADLKKKALIVLQTKCNVCHTRQNPRKVFTVENVDGLAPKIYKQVFVKRRMPRGNEIKLTAAEEATLLSWLKTRIPIEDH